MVEFDRESIRINKTTADRSLISLPVPLKLIEKNFLDLRNMFSNQKKISECFSHNKKNKLTEKDFLVSYKD